MLTNPQISEFLVNSDKIPEFWENFYPNSDAQYLILQSQKKGGDSVNGEVIAGGDEFLLNISLINVDVSYVISATKIEPITF